MNPYPLSKQVEQIEAEAQQLASIKAKLIMECQEGHVLRDDLGFSYDSTKTVADNFHRIFNALIGCAPEKYSDE